MQAFHASDLNVNRNLQAPLGPSSGSSSEIGNDVTTAAGGLQGTFPPYPAEPSTFDAYQQMPSSQDYNPNAYGYNPDNSYQPSAPGPVQQQTSYFANNPPSTPAQNGAQPGGNANEQLSQQQALPQQPSIERHESIYGDWMAPATGGAAAGVLGAEAYHHHQQKHELQNQEPAQEAAQINSNSMDHTTTTLGTSDSVVAPISQAPEPNNLTSASSAVPQPFLGEPEVVPVASSSKAANGGTAKPGVKRQGTDFSVSDLHVPGEFPKTPGF